MSSDGSNNSPKPHIGKEEPYIRLMQSEAPVTPWWQMDRSSDFQRFFRFGLVDNSLLLISMLTGLGLDDVIAKRLGGVRGFGPVIGAGVGNAIATGVAGLSDGTESGLGVVSGALLPMVPVLIALLLRKPLEGNTSKMLMGSSAALLIVGFSLGRVESFVDSSAQAQPLPLHRRQYRRNHAFNKSMVKPYALPVTYCNYHYRYTTCNILDSKHYLVSTNNLRESKGIVAGNYYNCNVPSSLFKI